MVEKNVRDIMVPISEYAVVDENDSVLDALIKLKESQINIPPDKFKHRAVLVRDKNGDIVGKIGHWAFLRSLEPKYDKIGDLGILSRAGLTPEFISSLAVNWELFKGPLDDYCKKLKEIKVSTVMHPISEHIDINSSLNDAIHYILMWQTLSIVVTDKNKIVGILRLSDLFQEVFGRVVGGCQ
ncbi:MAG: CBS domain-containing protein [Candidatus Zixiibacteriota bacterium]